LSGKRGGGREKGRFSRKRAPCLRFQPTYPCREKLPARRTSKRRGKGRTVLLEREKKKLEAFKEGRKQKKFVGKKETAEEGKKGKGMLARSGG